MKHTIFNFEKSENIIDRIVLHQTRKKKNVIYGRKALNRQLPPHLQRPTKDWDIWSKHIRPDAYDLERKLDRRFGGDYYYTKKLPTLYNKQVYSVYEHRTKEKIADFSEMPSGSGFYTIVGGVRWQTLSDAKKHYKEILDDPNVSFRHQKAKYDLWTIEEFEHQLKTKHKVHGSMFESFLVKPKYTLR